MVLGVTGSIAAYKAAEIASTLCKKDIDVRVIMTKAACEFITPLTFETITANPVVNDMFNCNTPWEVEHIALAKRADVFAVAPATANFIGKYAHGICDDMLTTTAMATKAQLVIAPAMNSQMYMSQANQLNMNILKDRGCIFVEPNSGLLACGDIGIGRLEEPEPIVAVIMNHIYPPKLDFKGKHVLVTAGPTRELLDPVRYISNKSSGKMGYAIAQAVSERGADVVLITGPTQLDPPKNVRLVRVESSEQMFNAAMAYFESCDICIKAAAPADFTPEHYVEFKIKKSNDVLPLSLVKTKDILSALGEKKGNRFLCGFAAETNQVEEYAMGKLSKKHLDMIVANDVTMPGAGFNVDTNIVTMYFAQGDKRSLSIMPKRQVADEILSEILRRI